jgi:hypothetical protein
MTIAIALKVGDAVVLGADSASTLTAEDGNVVNVYFNAEKIFNLYKGLPIGAVTYGLGSLDGRSVSALAKDLRQRLSPGGQWELDPTKYTIEQVVDRIKEFFYKEHYLKEWPKKRIDAGGNDVDVFTDMGFFVGGYSTGERKGEIWSIGVDKTGTCTSSETVARDKVGAQVGGQPEAILRLLNGWSPRVLDGLVASGVPQPQALTFLQSQQMEPLIQAGMPLQDAIDLVRYLIEVTAGFVQFIPGAPSVHPPIDLAAISYHEHFRWVKRKHYYSSELNPDLPRG